MPSFAQCLLKEKASAAEPYPACAGIPTVQSRMPFTLHPVMKEAYILSLSGLYRMKICLSRGTFCGFLFSFTVPLVDKSTYAWQHVFSALFVLFALMGYDTSASQKPKITRKSKAVRCAAVLPEQKCVQATKSPQVILCVLPRALRQHGHISARQNRVCPCQSMVIYDIIKSSNTKKFFYKEEPACP